MQTADHRVLYLHRAAQARGQRGPQHKVPPGAHAHGKRPLHRGRVVHRQGTVQLIPEGQQLFQHSGAVPVGAGVWGVSGVHQHHRPVLSVVQGGLNDLLHAPQLLPLQLMPQGKLHGGQLPGRPFSLLPAVCRDHHGRGQLVHIQPGLGLKHGEVRDLAGAHQRMSPLHQLVQGAAGGGIAVGGRDHGDGGARRHQRSALQPVGQQPGRAETHLI